MTQREARNAIRTINHQLASILTVKPDAETLEAVLMSIYEDLTRIETQLQPPKQATPNCRPVTQDELRTLCASSNVVLFPAAA